MLEKAETVRGRPPLPPLAIRAWLRWDVVVRHLDALAPQTVLEIGCGRGAMGARVARRSTYLGLEPDRESFCAAKRNIEGQGGHVLNVTAENLPRSQAFDLVCAFEVLEHIEEDAQALGDWARRIAPGGHLLISVPAFRHRFGPMDVQAGHYRRYDPDDLIALVRKVGLEPVCVTLYGWPLGYALESVRNQVDSARAVRRTTISKAELTSASGRTFQPTRKVTGQLIWAATLPFRLLQRVRPTRGVGIVLLAQMSRAGEASPTQV